MLTVAELVARLRADNTHFHRGIAAAERDLMRLDKAGTSVTRGLAQLGQRVDQIASGMALLATTAAISLAHVGTQYNTLLQRTNAAFKVLLGNAEAATKMVGDLTEFARGSPFPRQLFIQGAQQLLGFGLAAEKVVPAFEAIQDAVAAVGGGAQEIAQFTDVFAQIKSLGRANTETLMRFSSVGIDAFKMLADQAGVSSIEMRKRITEGMMGADETIEMLTTGLTEKFEGAAAGVKETWVGAKDRIAGAWRDIGSKLMAPFIDPNGGGAAVQWANQIADLLRKLEADVVPNVAAGIERLVDSFAKLTEDLEVDEWLERLGVLWDKHGDSMKNLIPILAGVTAGFTKQGLSMIPFLDNFVNALPLPGKLTGGLIGLVLSSDESRAALLKLGETLKDSMVDIWPKIEPMLREFVDRLVELVPPLIEIAGIVIETAWPVFALGMQTALEVADGLLMVLKPIAEFLGEHPILVKAVVASWAAFKVMSLASQIGHLTTRLQSWAAAQQAVNIATAQGMGVQVGQAGLAAINANLATFGTRAGSALGAVSLLRTGLAALGKVALPVALITGFMEVMTSIQSANMRLDDFLVDLQADVGELPAERAIRRLNRELKNLDQNKDLNPGQRGLLPWVTAPGEWAADKLGIRINDKRDEAEEAIRRMRTGIAVAAAFNQVSSRMATTITGVNRVMGSTADVVGETVMALLNGERAFTRMGNAAAQAVYNMSPIGERIMETSTAINESMRAYASPMAAWGAAQSAISSASTSNPVADAYRDLEDAQRAAARSGQEIADAQERVNEVMARQFDVASAAGAAIDDLVAAQRASLDPVFAMMRALDRRGDMKVGPTVQADNTKPLSFTNEKGNTVLDLAEANLGVNSAAIGLAGSIAAGVTSFEQVKAQISQWVEQGLMTQKEAESLYSEVQKAITTAQGLQPDAGTSVMAGVAEQRAEFQKEFDRDLRDAMVGVQDAILAAEDANRRVAEAMQGVSGAMSGGFSTGAAAAKASMSDLIKHLESRISDMANWQNNIREIARKGGVDFALEIAKWGPEAAPLVAEIAAATEPEFNKFKDLALESAALTSEGMIAEMETMSELMGQVGADTVAELEASLGVMPGTISAIGTHALEDFDFMMKLLALLAEEGGKATAGNLARTLAGELDMKYSEVWSKIQEYGGMFDWLGEKISDIAGGWNLVALSIMTQLEQIGGALPDNLGAGGTLGILGALADGGILKFGNGGFGENHIAQVSRGMMRMWSEPETGGEAYIPLALSKRARSMSILGQVAGLFGMDVVPQNMTGDQFYATGGSSSSGSSGGNVFEIEQNIYNYGPESGAERGVRELEKMAYLNGWGEV